ncbi:MAG: glutamine--fructose-6-phosphate transaminase (isomerizing) [Rhodospirillales bacterium]|jgi:glucosamine--fructose-6-phosphate aminotransferase (isomerizing)|tara:strand:+ start:449 stop:2272 length:1824 start_codon:yes stop_codon:yes gene_type:complete
MCGIIGIIGKEQASDALVDGLKRLEYRGYDSAGIATLHNGQIERRRAEGKIKNLVTRISELPIQGRTGIGHTRWATHGVPNEENAHPHSTERVAIVHNGIIENFQELRKELVQAGCNLASDTDTEIIVHLIDQQLIAGKSPIDATGSVLKRLTGAFALGVIFAGEENLMIAARKGSPLAIGIGDGESYLGSDAIALAPLTQKIIYLDDGDWAVITSDYIHIFDAEDNEVEREIKTSALSGAAIGKGGYRHFMLKEIYEQPQVIGDTLHSYINPTTRTVTLPALNFDLASIKKMTLIACGSSYIACLIAKYWLEQIARISVEVDIASEFRYRESVMEEGGAALFISQSGETIDTLAALRYAKSQNQHILSVVNSPESAIARESDAVFHSNAGPEIGVASTKALTTQLTVLACFCVALAKARCTITDEEQAHLTNALTEIPARAAEILNHDERIAEIASSIYESRDALYLGRGTSYAVALEGALKLKEISYIHAEGYAAGEMKHGPIALIDEDMPVIVIAPTDHLLDKTISNVEQVMARGGRLIFLSDEQGAARIDDQKAQTITLPTVDPFVAPILYTIPVQLLAYHVAVLKGTDVDQPRNLAKSVTVE